MVMAGGGAVAKQKFIYTSPTQRSGRSYYSPSVFGRTEDMFFWEAGYTLYLPTDKENIYVEES
jgi:hypothetical protein